LWLCVVRLFRDVTRQRVVVHGVSIFWMWPGITSAAMDLTDVRRCRWSRDTALLQFGEFAAFCESHGCNVEVLRQANSANATRELSMEGLAARCKFPCSFACGMSAAPAEFLKQWQIGLAEELVAFLSEGVSSNSLHSLLFANAMALADYLPKAL
jgi:hypothetical protein